MVSQTRFKAIERKIKKPQVQKFYQKWGFDELTPMPDRKLKWKDVMGGEGPEEMYLLGGSELGIPQ